MHVVLAAVATYPYLQRIQFNYEKQFSQFVILDEHNGQLLSVLLWKYPSYILHSKQTVSLQL